MDRAELEGLDRESLVLRAQAAGVRRARLLTRPELVDELLRSDRTIDPTQLKRTRGFFGRARDLLSRVVERGLHLPDAADRLRAALGNPLPQVPRPEPQAIPTVTLAEIYAAQGHRQRAIDTLRRVLELEPDHGAARALLEKLQSEDYVGPAPRLSPEPEETRHSEPPPARSEEAESLAAPEPEVRDAPAPAPVMPAAVRGAAHDECVAIPGPDGRTYVWWRLTAGSQEIASGTPFVVRALVVMPTWDGPQVSTRDRVCDPDAGEVVLKDLPGAAIVRVAVGTLDHGRFVSLAHSAALERTGAKQLVRWTLEGPLPVVLDAEPAIARAVARAAELGA